MKKRIYVLDADVFITAYQRYYAFDLVPAFWDCLAGYADIGVVRSIDYVKWELRKGRKDDELFIWTKSEFDHAFASTNDEDVVSAYGTIMRRAFSQQQFTSAAKNEFAQGADAWLIAYSMAKDCIVVTLETFSKGVKRSIKIPNVCKSFGITCIDTFEMLRELGGMDTQAAATRR